MSKGKKDEFDPVAWQKHVDETIAAGREEQRLQKNIDAELAAVALDADFDTAFAALMRGLYK